MKLIKVMLSIVRIPALILTLPILFFIAFESIMKNEPIIKKDDAVKALGGERIRRIIKLFNFILGGIIWSYLFKLYF